METPPSVYNQSSFVGGMSLLGDDSYLQPNQYRIAFNCTQRFGEFDLIPSSIPDEAAPKGIKQAITNFGNYIILFVAGQAFYKYYSDVAWISIPTFQMSMTAPRYWTCAVPIALTNYVRIAATTTISTTGDLGTTANARGAIQLNQVAGTAQGNLPGLVVQDGLNQPVFIFLNDDLVPEARTLQTFSQWSCSFTDATNVTVALDLGGNPMDFREYVPIGTYMAWNNGVLYVVDPTGNYIYTSVEGRPLDFVINVLNTLATDNTQVITYDPFGNNLIPSQGNYYPQFGGGDATTTAYSVGVGGISCLFPLASGGLFVSAAGANFSLTQNTTPNAPTLFGEYTYIRTFLFAANCLSDRAILNTIGDTRFIDLTGIRSFNAVESVQNEGRNSPFSADIQSIFGPDNSPIVQSASASASVLYNNYELYSVSTILGPAIAKYDTINNCWVSFDVQQVPGYRVKQFAALQINILALFCITENDQVYQLYASTSSNDTGVFRTIGVTSNLLYANYNIKMNNPENEVKLIETRIILNKIVANSQITLARFVNNCVYPSDPDTKTVTFEEPFSVYDDGYTLPDVNTQLTNVRFPSPNIKQGWKVFAVVSWTGGTIPQFSMKLENITPMNPLNSQGLVK